MITLDRNQDFLKIKKDLHKYTFPIGLQINGDYTRTVDWRVGESRTTSHRFWLKSTLSEISPYEERESEEAAPPAAHSVTAWPGQDRPLAFLPLNRTEWTPQVTVLDRDKMPHPQSTERERKKKRKEEEERLFEDLIWIWTLDLMVDRPSCSGRNRLQQHRSGPNTFL